MKRQLVLTSFLAAMLLAATNASAALSIYSIDNIFDTSIPGVNWLNTAPTLTPGAGYNITIDASGADDCPIVECSGEPSNAVRLGLFMDSDELRPTPADWADYTDGAILSASVEGLGDELFLNYSLNGLLSVPLDVNPGPGYGLAFLWTDDSHTPTIAELLDPQNGTVVMRTFAFNVERINTNAVPEPASLLLFGTGLAGAFIRRRKAA